MRIAEVIGKVTLSRAHPTLQGLRWVIGVPHSLEALRKDEGGDREDVVIVDQMGAGVGDLISFSEGVEGAAPFFPEKKPIDAYCACILDSVTVLSSHEF